LAGRAVEIVTAFDMAVCLWLALVIFCVRQFAATVASTTTVIGPPGKRHLEFFDDATSM
jgi:hypothetical protein